MAGHVPTDVSQQAQALRELAQSHERLTAENQALQLREQSHLDDMQRVAADLRDKASAERSALDAAHSKTIADLSSRHESSIAELVRTNERLQAENKALQGERLATLEEASRLHSEDEKLRSARQSQIAELQSMRDRQAEMHEQEKRRLDESHRASLTALQEKSDAAIRLANEEVERERAKLRTAESRWHSELGELRQRQSDASASMVDVQKREREASAIAEAERTALSDLRKQYDELTARADSTRSKLQSELDAALANVSAMERQQRASEAELSKQERTIALLSDEKAALSQESSLLEQRLKVRDAALGASQRSGTPTLIVESSQPEARAPLPPRTPATMPHELPHSVQQTAPPLSPGSRLESGSDARLPPASPPALHEALQAQLVEQQQLLAAQQAQLEAAKTRQEQMQMQMVQQQQQTQQQMQQLFHASQSNIGSPPSISTPAIPTMHQVGMGHLPADPQVDPGDMPAPPLPELRRSPKGSSECSSRDTSAVSITLSAIALGSRIENTSSSACNLSINASF